MPSFRTQFEKRFGSLPKLDRTTGEILGGYVSKNALQEMKRVGITNPQKVIVAPFLKYRTPKEREMPVMPQPKIDDTFYKRKIVELNTIPRISERVNAEVTKLRENMQNVESQQATSLGEATQPMQPKKTLTDEMPNLTPETVNKTISNITPNVPVAPTISATVPEAKREARKAPKPVSVRQATRVSKSPSQRGGKAGRGYSSIA